MNKKQPFYTTSASMAQNISINNMFYRPGNIVEIAEPEDDEQSAILSPFKGRKYVIADLFAAKETYYLYDYDRYVASDVVVETQYIGNGLEPTEFIDADLVPAVPEIPFDINIDSVVTHLVGRNLNAESIFLSEEGTLQYLYEDANIQMDLSSNGEFVLYTGGKATISCSGNIKYYATQRDVAQEVATYLGELFVKIGIDKPSNYDDIHDFIVNDVRCSADPADFHTGDMAISFRRLLETKIEMRG